MLLCIDKDQCKKMMLYVAERIIENEPYLTEIDLKIGDGDHGTGMKRGFTEIKKELPLYVPDTPEDVFKKMGTLLLDSMGGASGVLFGTVFISGITRKKSMGILTLKDFSEIFRMALEALKTRGRAQVGDKTMVDAFEPAVCALEEGVKKNKSICAGFKDAADAALKGMEYTATIKARFGRAKYFGDKAIGLQDAGATSVWIIFRSMSEWINMLQEEVRS